MRVSKVTPVVKSQPAKRRAKPITPQTKFVFDPKTDKVEWRNPTPINVLERRAKEAFYKSDIDPAVIIHSNKTHRTVDEAFRTANYATPIWRCETEWDRTKEYLKWIAMWFVFFYVLYLFVTGFEKWIA